MSRFLRSLYYYPLSGTKLRHQLVYAGWLHLLKRENSATAKYIKHKLVQGYLEQTKDVQAFRQTYADVHAVTYENFHALPITNKLNFHMRFPDVQDRLSDKLALGQTRKLSLLKTSGSTTGQPSTIPISNDDILYIRNYYRLLGNMARIIFPHKYKCINMFPISNSSTGQYSELLIPEEFRLGRSNADCVVAERLLMQGFMEGMLNKNIPLVLSGLPILHLELIAHLQRNKNVFLLEYLKMQGICLYGGESPTLDEKLGLYQYYAKAFSIYGSTELGPKLGFAFECNLVIDCALQLPPMITDLGIAGDGVNTGSPGSFFWDHYLNSYEVKDGSLVNTPLIQQTELKIRWDQDDYGKLLDQEALFYSMHKHRDVILQRLEVLDKRYATKLANTFVKMLDGSDYAQLFKHFGVLLLYGRKGILYGGANLDNLFAKSVQEELEKSKLGEHVLYFALYKSPKKQTGEAVYSGLRLDLLVETDGTLSQNDLKKLKNDIVALMRYKHIEFEKILGYYEHQGKAAEVLKGITLWDFARDTSPMHARFTKSKKRNWIIREFNEEEYPVVSQV